MHAFPDSVQLEYQGYPIAQDAEDRVPDDKNNQNRAKLRFGEIPSHILTRYNSLVVTLNQ